jgi:hypothetical protein
VTSRSDPRTGLSKLARPASSQISVGARALAKKLGHAESGGYRSAFDGLAATTENAQTAVQQIMSSPSRTVFGNRTYDVYDALGRGARFDKQGNFVTFLEAAKATR